MGVAAQWQSAGGLSRRPRVRLPVVPPSFLSICCFKQLQTVKAQIIFH